MQTELEAMSILRLSNEEANHITRECLRVALLKLMNDKPFDKINITEIVQKAGVSRTAFYRNYKTKEALVQDICRTIFEETAKSVGSDRFCTDRRQWYVSVFQTIRDNSEYYRIYLDAGIHLSNSFVLESVYPSSNIREHYAIAAREGAFSTILEDWFRSGMKESPEEMGQICEDILHQPGFGGFAT